MKKLAFIKRSNGSHWVGNGFPVQSIFSYRDIYEEMSPFLLKAWQRCAPTISQTTAISSLLTTHSTPKNNQGKQAAVLKAAC